MNARKRIAFTLTALLLGANLLIGLRVHSTEAARNGESEALDKITVMMQVLHLVQKDYVHADKVDFTELIYAALRGMVSSLDPFSAFMPADEFDDIMESTEGEFGGLGIIVTIRDGVLTVVAPIEDTPGSRAGILAGDQIIRIGEEPTERMELSKAVKRLKGEPGTSVTITILRPDTGETKELTIARAIIPLVTVKDACVLDGDIGYVRVVQFSEPTADRLREALQSLVGQGIRTLILDLRNNPGGLLESAVDVSSFFVPSRNLVVSTEGRQASQKRVFLAHRGWKFPDMPIAILVNEGSASAAEIVAGCLQDWGRAVLVGERTFGKGSVQNIVELPDGSALRLTTAMYYTPSRNVIHENGVAPDFEVKLSPEDMRRVLESQILPVANGQRPSRDPQLARAIETLGSYKVYLDGRKAGFRKLKTPETPVAGEDDATVPGP